MKTALALIIGAYCMALGACVSSRSDGFNYGHQLVSCKHRGTC